MQFVFVKLDLHKSLLVLIHSNIEFHFQVFEPPIKLTRNFLNGRIALLLRPLIPLTHAITPPKLPQSHPPSQQQNQRILPNDVLEIFKEKGFDYGYEQQQAEGGDDGAVWVDGALEQGLGLLVFADVEVSVHVFYQFFEGLVVDVKVGDRQVVHLEAQPLVGLPVYFYAFRHRIHYNEHLIRTTAQHFTPQFSASLHPLMLPFFCTIHNALQRLPKALQTLLRLIQRMINANIYSSFDRSPKVGLPTFPPAQRKNIEYALILPFPMIISTKTPIQPQPKSSPPPKETPEQTCRPFR